MTEMVVVARGAGCGGGGVCGGCGGAGGGVENGTRKMGSSNEEENQLSLLELILAALKKSMAACRFDDDQIQESKNFKKMEIGCPTDVQHLTHVTFDRFHGFLGLPVEFQVEIPSRVPSASVSVFGVSAESMQCSYDSRGNSVPTILLLMQKRLYDQGGLKAEGIFRINPENSHEEHVRDQLNRGRVPEDIEVHCLAGLIKAWFRELPCGVLDGLSPDEVLQCNTEEERVELVKQLKPTETALLNWAIDLMSDVAEQEESNKMNSRNIAMVFAPNMTQMSDPLTALMHAVQVMNLLKTLITKTLREREETTTMTGGFSPTWGPLTDDEFNHHEEMQTSCELRRQVSSEDEEEVHQRCSDVESLSEMQTSCELRRQVSSEDEEDAHQQCSDVESLSKMEENFLEQIKENKNAKNRFKKELEDLVTEHFSPTNRFKSNEDSLGASLVSKESETGLFNVHYTNL